MNNFKEKLKNFWDEHKADVMLYGGALIVGSVTGAYVYKSYMDGFEAGVGMGAITTAFMLDSAYPEESKAIELLSRYEKEHRK